MHELGITQSIVEIAERTAREQGAQRVTRVTVEIGALCGVVPAAVEFCFEACTAGTLLQGCRLEIHHVPGQGRCGACASQFPLAPQTFVCPVCGALGPTRLTGEELRVIELEVD